MTANLFPLLLFILIKPIAESSATSENACAEIEKAFTEPDGDKPMCQCLPTSIPSNSSQSDGDDQFWIGCTRQKMPALFRSLFSMNETRIWHLQIWDSLIPILPSEMFSKVRPEKLSIETSRVGVLRGEAFANMGHSLKELSLKNNILKDFEEKTLANLVELTKLDLSGNKLTQIKRAHLSTLTKLESLMLAGNQLSRLDDGLFQSLGNLRTLNLANNRLKRITKDTFKGLGMLETLILRDNRIESIDVDAFSHLKSLKILDLWHNKIAKVELRANAKLERLILANNSISELSDVRLDGLPSLGSLHLEDNKIQMIADGDLLPLKASAKLAALTLDGNNISWIGCDAFEPLPTLLVLSLQRNKISSLSCSSTRDPDPTSFPIYLDRSVLEPLHSLRRLLLSHNNIAVVNDEDLVGLESLRDLALDHNKISKIGRNSFNRLTRLRRLFLNNNNLYYLSKGVFDGLDNAQLQAVDISVNKWECICGQEWIGGWLAELGAANTNSGTLGCLIGKCEKPESDEQNHVVEVEGHELWIRMAAIVLAVVAVLFLVIAGFVYVQENRYVLPIRRSSSDTIRLIPSQENLFSFPNPIGPEASKQQNAATTATVPPLSIHASMGKVTAEEVNEVKRKKMVRFNE